MPHGDNKIECRRHAIVWPSVKPRQLGRNASRGLQPEIGCSGNSCPIRRKLLGKVLVRSSMFCPLHSNSQPRSPRLLVAISAFLIALAATSACTRSNASSDKAPAAAQTPQPVQPQPPAEQPQTAQAPTDLAPELAELHRKADAGNAYAMVQLANAYERGEGAPRNADQAVAWLKKAANAGDSYAMYRLARLCATGSGVQKDYVEAFGWYKRAAAAGNSEAMYDLARAYETGSGVREDVQQAVVWYTKAYQHGNQPAKAALVRLGEGYEDHP